MSNLKKRQERKRQFNARLKAAKKSDEANLKKKMERLLAPQKPQHPPSLPPKGRNVKLRQTKYRKLVPAPVPTSTKSTKSGGRRRTKRRRTKRRRTKRRRTKRQRRTRRRR